MSYLMMAYEADLEAISRYWDLVTEAERLDWLACYALDPNLADLDLEDLANSIDSYDYGRLADELLAHLDACY